jgi:exodeoxyribonuclease VII large subunit
MSGKLLQELISWRDKEASRRGVEKYRVLQNKSLQEIAETQPETKEELLEIYGIAEKKYDSYGQEILDIIADDQAEQSDPDEPITVGQFLTQINQALRDHTSRVSGEVVEFDIRDNYLFFTIKDPEAEASMQCFMWRKHYDVSDVDLEEGLEVAVEGQPEVYKPNGRFTFRAQVIEFVGEGALKKAYEKLKAKLQEAGLFANERKQSLPAFPQSVGLITSRESDAYHDFLANLGSFGFSVQFYPSRVQGAKAVKDLLEALDYFADTDDVDAVVITRGGGGNLEVLQAFNNEAVVKKLANLDIPVIVGIGHEQDEPLASLAADQAVSTPTACADLLNRPWNKLTQRIEHFQTHLFREYQQVLYKTSQRIASATQALESHMETTFLSFDAVINTLQEALQRLEYRLRASRERMRQLGSDLFAEYQKGLTTVGNKLGKQADQMEGRLQAVAHTLADSKKQINRYQSTLVDTYQDSLKTTQTRIETYADQLKRVDPKRRLEQGYSIVSVDGEVIKEVNDVAVDNDIDIQVADGTIGAHVTNTSSDNDNR